MAQTHICTHTHIHLHTHKLVQRKRKNRNRYFQTVSQKNVLQLKREKKMGKNIFSSHGGRKSAIYKTHLNSQNKMITKCCFNTHLHIIWMHCCYLKTTKTIARTVYDDEGSTDHVDKPHSIIYSFILQCVSPI